MHNNDARGTAQTQNEEVLRYEHVIQGGHEQISPSAQHAFLHYIRKHISGYQLTQQGGLPFQMYII